MNLVTAIQLDMFIVIGHNDYTQGRTSVISC